MVTKIKPRRMNTSNSWTTWDSLLYQADTIFNWQASNYKAGKWISITDTMERDTQWPSPSGYHVPTTAEWQGIYILIATFGLAQTWATTQTYLKMPLAGWRSFGSGSPSRQNNFWHYWSSTGYQNWDAYYLEFTLWRIAPQAHNNRGLGYSIRCFKNTPEIPDSSWTTLYDWSSIATDAWIFHNATLWLISISWDGVNRTTIMDKNLGATVVYNSWDALSDSNCWYFYQRWNNYGFPWSWYYFDTSGTQVNASGYWPWNYYYSKTFITSYSRSDRSSVENNNLWGWVTDWIYRDWPKISNTWVLSVNGETWDITITQKQADWNQNDISQVDYIKNKPTIPAAQVNSDWNAISWVAEILNKPTLAPVATSWNYNDLSSKPTAWQGISIADIIEKDTKWPAPSGYHIPTRAEWQSVRNILITTFWFAQNWATAKTYLKMPYTWYRYSGWAGVSSQGSEWSYWESSAVMINYADSFRITSTTLTNWQNALRATGFPVRCFKNTSVTPDSSWTTLYDGSSIAANAWIFHNSTLGLISISWDWTTWYTIMDKNLWATVVYNDGDALSESNCWYYYQRWNNYGFPWSGSATVTTSSTQVDTTWYWPWNYYSSSTYIFGGDWSSVNNTNLRWWTTNWTFNDWTKISNTWVLSVNWQTWDITIAAGWDIAAADFETEVATSGATLTISDYTTSFTPSVDFTVSAWTVKEWMQYILRIPSWATAYTMTLGTWITNPYGETLTLTASKTTTVVFFATSSSTLELFGIKTEA